MAGFLRKKSKQQEPAEKPLPPPQQPVTVGAPTPLYARFATASAGDSTQNATPRVVSGPMALAKRESLTNGRPVGGEATRRTIAGPAQVASATLTNKPVHYPKPSPPEPSVKSVPPSSFSLPAQDSSGGATRLSSSFGEFAHYALYTDPVPDTPPQPPSNKDKPLPNAHSPREPNDILSSPPPPPSLPSNKRISTRVVPQNPGQVSDSPRPKSQVQSVDNSPLTPSNRPSTDSLRPTASRTFPPTSATNSTVFRKASLPTQQPAAQYVPQQRRQSIQPQILPQEAESIADQNIGPPLSRSISNGIKPERSHDNPARSSPIMSTTVTSTITQPPPPSAPSAYHTHTPRKSNSQGSMNNPPPSATRGKPLIFTATTTVSQESLPSQTRHSSTQNAYPTPPTEYSQPPITVDHQQQLASQSTKSNTQSPPPRTSSDSSSYVNQNLGYGQTPRMDPILTPVSPPASVRRQPLPQAVTPPRARQVSAAPTRTPSDASIYTNGQASARRLTKHRPTTPVSLDQEIRPPSNHGRVSDVPYFADDPFAKADGVRMLPPTSPPKKVPQSPSKGKGREDSPPVEDVQPLDTSPSPEPVPEPRAASPSPSVTEVIPPRAPPTPPPSEEYKRSRRTRVLEKSPPRALASLPVTEDRPAEPFLLDVALGHISILEALLPYITFYEWLVLNSVTKKVRKVLSNGGAAMKEAVLERYLQTVGYSRWIYKDPEPLSLSLEDLYSYMLGVTMPTHEYSRIAQSYLQTHASERSQDLISQMQNLTAATRSYTRVVLRLRAQAEKEASYSKSEPRSPSSQVRSRGSSRAPSPASTTQGRPTTPVGGFKSPLFRLRRAPLLRCFVPSPDGDWLSDASVLECEAELKRAGVLHMMRVGDVVWDIAVGDEGNVGRSVWDGSYLIDLDYTYSTIGDLPRYLPTMAFPPSYFHRVIRTGQSSSNPVVRIDLSPWGEEIAANLQLLQDRVRTETPQGTYHNVVRWVHRSSFVLRPQARTHHRSRIPIPDSNGLFVDSAWYGTIVVETEGTNESLADLQERCGPGAFPPRVGSVVKLNSKDKDAKMVFRILRERSRPGEIWIRTVGPKERLN